MKNALNFLFASSLRITSLALKIKHKLVRLMKWYDSVESHYFTKNCYEFTDSKQCDWGIHSILHEGV